MLLKYPGQGVAINPLQVCIVQDAEKVEGPKSAGKTRIVFSGNSWITVDSPYEDVVENLSNEVARVIRSWVDASGSEGGA